MLTWMSLDIGWTVWWSQHLALRPELSVSWTPFFNLFEGVKIHIIPCFSVTFHLKQGVNMRKFRPLQHADPPRWGRAWIQSKPHSCSLRVERMAVAAAWRRISRGHWIDSREPSGYVKIAIEAMAIEIVNCPIHSMVIFHSFLNVYQRVTT